MRSTFLLLLAATATATTTVAACGRGDEYDRYRRGQGSEIVFGIEQRTDAQTGKPVSVAGHEYLSLANRGGRSVSVDWVSDGDVCIHEELNRRIGRPNVGDGGRARFTGGAIPGDGLVIEANGPDEPKLEGNAFVPGQSLTFDVDFGFALPDLPSVRLASPNPHLTVTTPAETGELAVDVTKDSSFAWSPSLIDEMVSPQARERVMVAFETDDDQDRGNQVRCFYDEQDGAGVIPTKWLSLIGAKGTKGTLTIASHRQVDTYARGGWLVYVVGKIVLREQRFVVQ